MLKVSNVNVYNLKEAVIACRNAMRLELPAVTDEEFEQSLVRAKKLCKAGSPHNNFLCGITVSFDVVYPQYWSMEAQRYHWLNIVTSMSKMHRLAKMQLKDCVNKYVNYMVVDIEQQLIDKYNADPNYTNFMEMLSNCPMGLELGEHLTTNYLQLRNIYHQRKGHKLQEDWGTFCKMVEELPYASDFLL